jgi:hypothetical protein
MKDLEEQPVCVKLCLKLTGTTIELKRKFATGPTKRVSKLEKTFEAEYRQWKGLL